ncbi:50S ribosomal protein L24 [Candidatus Woesearchaeota archaeon]|nr:50S ribosomal protein L24 [Candidatus Woesearchaeota archaeon]
MENWSRHWKGSVKPRKQRAYAREAPIHVKRQSLAAHLSKELRGKHKTRSITLRVGDKVTVLRGQFRKKSGKVERVDAPASRVYVTGIELAKKDGGKSQYPLHPSNLIITELESDKRRFTERKA